MKMLSSRYFLIMMVAMALLAVAVLTACATSVATPTAVPTAPPPTPTPLPRGGNLTIRLSTDLSQMQPWQPASRGAEQLTSLLYNGLVRLDEELRPQPDLAQGWEASADGRTITFTLRSALDWHDGHELTADDVVFTLTALREITPTSALLADFQRITQVTAPTSTTVVLTLSERYAPIFADLTVPILPRHLLEGKDLTHFNIWDAPIGTGPFKFVERTPGESIVLAENQTYHRGRPLLDRVVFVVAPDQAVVDRALQDGELMLAEVPWNDARQLDQQIQGAQIGLYPENGYFFLAYNLRESRPFADLAVRQALQSAIDLPALVREVTDGAGVAIASSATPGSWADFVKPPTSTLDLERARKLLDDAGWTLPDGGSVREKGDRQLTGQLFVRGDDSRRVRAAQLISQAAATVGISVTVERVDFETVLKSKYAPPYDFDLLLGSWSNGAGDPTFADYAYYDPSDFDLFHSTQIIQGDSDTRPVLNITSFSDAAYDNQAAAARQLYDLEQRGKALQLAQERVAELQPYLFLWADQIPVVLSPKVTSLDGPIDLNTPMYLNTIERWYLQP